MKTFFKLFAIGFALLCIISAYLQLNDPDPLLWICMYLSAALAAVLFVLNKFPYRAYFLLFLGYIIGAYLFWPDKFEGVIVGSGNINNIEHARESLGLLILALTMLIFGVRSKKKE